MDEGSIKGVYGVRSKIDIDAVEGANAILTDDAEIVANLWYVIDDQGFIYSLRVMVYVTTGNEEQKLSFLRSREYLDYMVARPFPVPERFWNRFVDPEDGQATTYPVVHHHSAAVLGGVDQLFFEALDRVGSDLPAQTQLEIPESPLVNVTALYGVEGGRIFPVDALKE